MPGRPDFTTPGSGGSGQILAVNSRPEIKEVDASQSSTTVASGSTENTEVYAPTGSNYRILNARIDIKPDGAWTTGSHQLKMRTIAYGLNALLLKSTYTDYVSFKNGIISVATSDMMPNDEAAQGAQLRSLRATENSPIVLSYTNNGDVAQSNNRSYRFAVEEASF